MPLPHEGQRAMEEPYLLLPSKTSGFIEADAASFGQAAGISFLHDALTRYCMNAKAFYRCPGIGYNTGHGARCVLHG